MIPTKYLLFPAFLLFFCGCDKLATDNAAAEVDTPDIKISEVFREQIMRYLQVSGELEAATQQGLNVGDLRERLAKVKSAFELTSATWPANFEADAKDDFANAIEGWSLALDLWAGKIEKLDPPTYPNINGWQRYYAYGKDFLKVAKWDEYGPADYVGKQYVTEDNVGVLLSTASNYSKAGKTKILAGLAAAE